MMDIKQHLLSLKFKGVVKLFDENFTALPHENHLKICVPKKTFFFAFCVLT